MKLSTEKLLNQIETNYDYILVKATSPTFKFDVKVEVTIDTNDNGITGDAGDFRIEMPVSLLTGEVSYSMYLDSMDFYPLMP